jgi:hypothetical protein
LLRQNNVCLQTLLLLLLLKLKPGRLLLLLLHLLQLSHKLLHLLPLPLHLLLRPGDISCHACRHVLLLLLQMMYLLLAGLSYRDIIIPSLLLLQQFIRTGLCLLLLLSRLPLLQQLPTICPPSLAALLPVMLLCGQPCSKICGQICGQLGGQTSPSPAVLLPVKLLRSQLCGQLCGQTSPSPAVLLPVKLLRSQLCGQLCGQTSQAFKLMPLLLLLLQTLADWHR